MFPIDFLTAVARKYELSPEQEEVFLLWFLENKDNNQIAEKLYAQPNTIRSRKTGIYKKFSIAGKGANK